MNGHISLYQTRSEAAEPLEPIQLSPQLDHLEMFISSCSFNLQTYEQL